MPSLLAGLARMPRGKSGLSLDQKNFVNSFGKPGQPTRVVWSDCFGNGKSVAMDIKMLQLALKYPGILIWWGRAHYKNLLRNNWTLWNHIVPQDIWGYKVYGGRQPQSIVFPNGSEIAILGFHEASNNLGGAPGACFLEEVSEIDLEVWDYIQGRLRQPGIPEEAQILCGVGNPRGHYPLWRRFKGGDLDEDAQKLHLWYKAQDPWANAKNLPKNYYQNMIKMYPKELVDRFVKGSDDTHAGQIYLEFNREVHLVKGGFEWNKKWIPYVGCDYGRVDPTAVVFLGLDPDTGDVWQIAEYYQANVPTVDVHAANMDDIVAKVGFPKSDDAVGKVIDNNTNDPGGGNQSIRSMFADRGWYFQPSAGKRSSLMPGIERVKSLLVPRNGQPPKFHIHPRCVKTIEEFSMYEWSTPKSAVEMMQFKEQPREDYNHAMDALRYVVQIMPQVATNESPKLIGDVNSQMHWDDDEEDSDPRPQHGLIIDPRNVEAANNARKAGGWRFLNRL